METVFKSDAPIIRINYDYENALTALMENPESTELQDQYARAQPIILKKLMLTLLLIRCQNY